MVHAKCVSKDEDAPGVGGSVISYFTGTHFIPTDLGKSAYLRELIGDQFTLFQENSGFAVGDSLGYMRACSLSLH